MKKEKISTDRAPVPGGWYSQAFRVGNMIYTAGVTANDPKTQELAGPGDIVLQTRQVLKNLREILLEAGSDLDSVVKTLVFIADINEFDAFNEEYKKFFPIDPPARSTIQVGRFKGGMVIEIEAIAVAKE
jgi:2-iminobutanoate/2-iminopropanoate deaminase